MKEWPPNSRYGGHAFGLQGFAKFLAERENILPWIAEYSPYALVTKDDPPVYLIYSSPPALGQVQRDPTHTSNFGVKLQEHCRETGTDCELVYPGALNVKHATPTDYLISQLKSQDRSTSVSEKDMHIQMNVEGWKVLISDQLLEHEKAATERALELLTLQLQGIAGGLPADAVTELRKVPLWFSPEHPGVQQRAEYHPGAEWLRRNNRDPAMAKAIEFTSIHIFERETRRMPNFALHELAHAYHDRVLPGGSGNKAIRSAFQNANKEGLYESVEQRFGDGRSANVRAYAITNPMEYFAECSESFFINQ